MLLNYSLYRSDIVKILRLFAIVAAFTAFLASTAFADERLRLATTTSTENSGLLAVLIPPFEQSNNCKVDVISVGTGKAIKLGENGDVDVVMVHARSKEDKFVTEGYGVQSFIKHPTISHTTTSLQR